MSAAAAPPERARVRLHRRAHLFGARRRLVHLRRGQVDADQRLQRQHAHRQVRRRVRGDARRQVRLAPGPLAARRRRLPLRATGAFRFSSAAADASSASRASRASPPSGSTPSSKSASSHSATTASRSQRASLNWPVGRAASAHSSRASARVAGAGSHRYPSLARVSSRPVARGSSSFAERASFRPSVPTTFSSPQTQSHSGRFPHRAFRPRRRRAPSAPAAP